MTSHADTAPTSDAGEERDLNARRAAILEAVVTEYIGTAEPVGSSHVASAPGVQVSPATVRSEMVALEREGYLVQPHTSAGRIPTDKGYRFFVDHLAAPGVLGPIQRRQVTQFFDQVHGEMETVLERATGLLTELTSYAAVVVGPSHETATIRSVQLVGLLAAARAARRGPLRRGRGEAHHRPPRGDFRRGARTGRRAARQSPRGPGPSRSPGPCRPAGPGTPTRSSGPPAPPSAPWSRMRPTKCSWAVRRSWPSPSTPSRPCARCSASWSNSSSS